MEHDFNKAFIIRDSEREIESKINSLSLNNQRKRKEITINDVCSAIESKTGIPIYEIKNNSKKLLQFEKYLKKKIIGQDKVIEKLVTVNKKIMLGLKKDLPYSFLFIGKSGVGKTYLVKEYSKYFNIPLIRLDMSEYKESHTISKIIGSPAGYIGYNDVTNVLEEVKSNPYSIILLDEIEKACKEVINLFLQVLDEGVLTDSHGNKVSFNNTIIIMTSNLDFEKENIGFSKEKKYMDNSIFSIPFINRVNMICKFNSLNKEDILNILKNYLRNIKKEYKDKGINISLPSKELNKIIIDSEYSIYGARHAIKLLEDKIDEIVINSLLKEQNKIIYYNTFN